jgi:hypothetical protein
MAAFGAGVLAEVAVKLGRGLVPAAPLMTAIGILALAANGAGVLLDAGRALRSATAR